MITIPAYRFILQFRLTFVNSKNRQRPGVPTFRYAGPFGTDYSEAVTETAKIDSKKQHSIAERLVPLVPLLEV